MIGTDSFSLVTLMLSTFSEKVVKNSAISKTAKHYVFGSKGVLLNIANLFSWTGYIDTDAYTDLDKVKEKVREMVYEFLEHVCCSYKDGINFFDKSYGTSGNQVNKSILSFVTHLPSPENDILLKKLIAKCLKFCPDLLHSYFKFSLLTFDPGTPDHWVKNCSFYREICDNQPTVPAALDKYISSNHSTFNIEEITKMTLISLLPVEFSQGLFKSSIKSSNKVVKIEGLIIIEQILKRYKAIKNYINNLQLQRTNNGKFSTEDLNKLNENIANSVLATVVDLPTLANMCSNMPTNKENFSSTIRFEVIKCIALFSEVFEDIFIRSQFDFCSLLGGLFNLEEMDLADEKKHELIEKAFGVVTKFLIKNVQAYMWFKTENKQKSPFFYLLSSLSKFSNTLLEKTVPLIKKIVVINLVYNENNVDEFDIWLNHLSRMSSDRNALNYCVEFLTNTVGLIARKPHKFNEKEETNITAVKSKQYSSEWWGSIPDIHIEKFTSQKQTDNGNKSSSEALSTYRTEVSALVIAGFEAMKSLTDKKLKIIDKFLSAVLVDIIHCTKVLHSAKHFSAIVTPLISMSKSNWKQISSVIGFLEFYLDTNIKVDETLVCDGSLQENQSDLMKWFYTSVKSLSTKIKAFDITCHDILTECSSGTEAKIFENIVIYVNQLLLYLDIVTNIVPIKENESNRKVCLFHLSKLAFDILEQVKEEKKLSADYQRQLCNITFEHSVIQNNFFVTSGDMFLSDILTPKVLSNLEICSSTTNALKLIERYTEYFMQQLPNFSQQNFTDDMIIALKMFPKLCNNMSLDQLQSVLDSISTNFESISKSETMMTLFHSALEHMIIAIQENKLSSNKFLSFPKSSAITTCCEMITSNEISENLRNMLLTLLVKMLQNFTSNVINHFPRSFLKWCIKNISLCGEISTILEYIASDRTSLQSLTKVLLKNRSCFTEDNKHVLAPCIAVLIKSALLDKESSDQTTELMSLVTDNYKNLLIYECQGIESWNMRCFREFLLYFLQYQAKHRDKIFIGQLIKDLSVETFQNSNHLKYLICRMEVVLDIGITNFFKNKEIHRFFNACIQTAMQAIITLIGTKRKDSERNTIVDLYETINSLLIVAKTNCVELNNIMGKQWNKFFSFSLKHFINETKVLAIINLCMPILYQEENEELLSISMVWKMLTGHSKFLSIICTDSIEKEALTSKQSVIELLSSVSQLCHRSCFTSNDYLFLFGAYEATLQSRDVLLLELLKKYQDNNIPADDFKPFLWGQSALTEYNSKKNLGDSLWKKPTLEQVLTCIDPEIMARTLNNFPIRRRAKETSDFHASFTEELRIYDPVFLLPIFHDILDVGNYVECRKFISHGALSFTLMCLSSHCNVIRSLAITNLGLFYKHVESAVFPEKNLILYVLQLLRNEISLVNKDGEEEKTVQKISTVVSRFLAKTFQILITPSDHMYGILCKFLLIKPHFDLHNVPEFYVLFFSSHMEHKIERRWIINLLAESVSDLNDYHVIEKRTVCKTLLSFYDSVVLDGLSRRRVLQVVTRLCKINAVASNLILYQGLLSWIQSLCYNRGNIHEHVENLFPVLKEISKFVFNSKHKESQVIPPLVFMELKDICFLLLEECDKFARSVTYQQFVNTKNYDAFLGLLDIAYKCIEHLSKTEERTNGLFTSEMFVLYSVAKFYKEYNNEVAMKIVKLILYWKDLKVTSQRQHFEVFNWLLENYGSKFMEQTASEEIALFYNWVLYWCEQLKNQTDSALPQKFLLSCLKSQFTLKCHFISDGLCPVRTAYTSLCQSCEFLN